MIFYRRTYFYIISSCNIIIIRVVHSFLHYYLWRNYLYVKCKHKRIKHVLRSRRVKRGFCSIITYNRISIILQIEDTCIKPKQVSRSRITVSIYTIFICYGTVEKVTFNSLITSNSYRIRIPITSILYKAIFTTRCRDNHRASCFISFYLKYISSQIRLTF